MHVTVGCKILRSGRFWFLVGGFLQADVDIRDLIATRIAKADTIDDALASLDDRSIDERIRVNNGRNSVRVRRCVPSLLSASRMLKPAVGGISACLAAAGLTAAGTM